MFPASSMPIPNGVSISSPLTTLFDVNAGLLPLTSKPSKVLPSEPAEKEPD